MHCSHVFQFGNLPIVREDPIRAILLRDSTLVFVPDGADGLLSILMKSFQQCVQEKDSDTPYEFRYKLQC